MIIDRKHAQMQTPTAKAEFMSDRDGNPLHVGDEVTGNYRHGLMIAGAHDGWIVVADRRGTFAVESAEIRLKRCPHG